MGWKRICSSSTTIYNRRSLKNEKYVLKLTVHVFRSNPWCVKTCASNLWRRVTQYKYSLSTRCVLLWFSSCISLAFETFLLSSSVMESKIFRSSKIFQNTNNLPISLFFFSRQFWAAILFLPRFLISLKLKGFNFEG